MKLPVKWDIQLGQLDVPALIFNDLSLNLSNDNAVYFGVLQPSQALMK